MLIEERIKGIKKILKRNKELFKKIIPLIYILSMYLVGATKRSATTVFNTETKISMNPFLCIFTCFTDITSLVGSVLLGTILIAGIIKVMYRIQPLDMDEERNIKLSDKGTYGTAGDMTEEEQKNVLELKKVEDTYENILGEKDEDVFSVMEDCGLNRHKSICGGSGSRKTRAIAMPDILQSIRRGESYVVTDPKGEIYSYSSDIAKKHGFNVKVFNLKSTDVKYSDSCNLLSVIQGNSLMAQTFTEVIMKNTTGGKSTGDFWDKAERGCCTALILVVDQDPHKSKNEKTLGAVYELLLKPMAQIELLFDNLPQKHPARKPFSFFKGASDTVKQGVWHGLGIRLQVFQDEGIVNMTSYDEIDLLKPGTEKCAYYIVMDDQDSTLDFIAALFYSFLFMKLVRYADSRLDMKLPVPVNMIFDEFPNVAEIPDFSKKLATVRSRMINITVIFQDIGQMKDKFEGSLWSSILSNCDTGILLGTNESEETATFYSNKTGIMTIEVESERKQANLLFTQQLIPDAAISTGQGKRMVRNADEIMRMNKNHALLFIRGEKVIEVDKFDFSKHPLAKEIVMTNPSLHYPEWRKRTHFDMTDDDWVLAELEEQRYADYNEHVKEVEADDEAWKKRILHKSKDIVTPKEKSFYEVIQENREFNRNSYSEAADYVILNEEDQLKKSELANEIKQKYNVTKEVVNETNKEYKKTEKNVKPNFIPLNASRKTERENWEMDICEASLPQKRNGNIHNGTEPIKKLTPLKRISPETIVTTGSNESQTANKVTINKLPEGF